MAAAVVAPGEDAARGVDGEGVVVARRDALDVEALEPEHFVRLVVGAGRLREPGEAGHAELALCRVLFAARGGGEDAAFAGAHEEVVEAAGDGGDPFAPGEGRRVEQAVGYVRLCARQAVPCALDWLGPEYLLFLRHGQGVDLAVVRECQHTVFGQRQRDQVLALERPDRVLLVLCVCRPPLQQVTILRNSRPKVLCQLHVAQQHAVEERHPSRRADQRTVCVGRGDLAVVVAPAIHARLLPALLDLQVLRVDLIPRLIPGRALALAYLFVDYLPRYWCKRRRFGVRVLEDAAVVPLVSCRRRGNACHEDERSEEVLLPSLRVGGVCSEGVGSRGGVGLVA